MAFGSEGMSKIDYAKRLAGTLGYLAVMQGDAVGLSCIADNIVTEIPPRRNPAHLSGVFDLLERAKPTGGTSLVRLLHELADKIRQRALVIVISDFFVDPQALRGCFEHFRFRHHDLAALHLLDPLELQFKFHRPMRFIDMEGGPAVFAEPNEIADRYHKAVARYLQDLQKVVVNTAVDYHRVSTDTNYEQTLVQFLLGRTRAGGVR